MSEICEVGEQLSEEEITEEVQRILVFLQPYNNLKASVMRNRHHGMEMVESDPSLTKGDDKESQHFRDTVSNWEEYSEDLKKEMLAVGLKAEDGYAYQDIMSRKDRKITDLTFLREYAPKIDALYHRLKARWGQGIMGTTFDENKN